MRAFLRLSGCLVVLALLGLAQAGVASAFTLEGPVVRSHGKTERDACFRGGVQTFDDATQTFSPTPCKAQMPQPEGLPVHRAGRVTIRTAEGAERLQVAVRSRGGTRSFEADPRDDSGRRWSFRMPRFKNGSDLAITIDYADGNTSWTLPLKRHRHEPIYCPRTGQDRFDANGLVGKRVARARVTARSHDCAFRVIKRDGELQVHTADRRFDRINVVVNDGRVTRVDGVY